MIKRRQHLSLLPSPKSCINGWSKWNRVPSDGKRAGESSMKHAERTERFAALRIKLFWVLWKNLQQMSRKKPCTSFMPKVKHLTVNKKERMLEYSADEEETQNTSAMTFKVIQWVIMIV